MSRGGASGADLAAAVTALRAGLVVAIPTDTVYGLAVDPFRPGAVARIFEAKLRPATLDLPVLAADAAQAADLAADLPDDLVRAFWPGPLTLVVRRAIGLSIDLGRQRETIGLRVPDHDVARSLCRAVGPLATTSANLHGRPTLATAGEIAWLFGDQVAVVVEGGRCAGAPSTVVDCTGPSPRLLREGRLPWSDIEAVSAGDPEDTGPAL